MNYYVTIESIHFDDSKLVKSIEFKSIIIEVNCAPLIVLITSMSLNFKVIPLRNNRDYTISRLI